MKNRFDPKGRGLPDGSRPGTAGSALIISLIFVVLITILVLGYFSSAKTERASAGSHLQGLRSEYFADMGADLAIARLQKAFGSVPSGGTWVSGPGRIFSVGSGTATETFLLSSGTVPRGVGADEAVDLNASLPGSNRGVLTHSGTAMPVSWIYVLKDGSLTPAAPPTFDPANPAVGRLAFWADDESCKINTNTAFTRGVVNTRPASHPSQVNLETAFPASAAEISAFRSGSHFFLSPLDISAVNATVAAVTFDNRFSLTHLNASPELNMFGEPRIVLTTQKSLAGGGDFLDILNTDNSDPGTVASLNSAKLNAVVQKITGYLNRSDWPMLPGKSFTAKFAQSPPVRPEQIALNIIEYVRARESARELVEPIRGEVSGGTLTLSTALSSNSLMGNTRGVRITEVGFYLIASGSAAPQEYRLQVVMELHLPRLAGLEEMDLRKLSVTYNLTCYSATPPDATNIWQYGFGAAPNVFGPNPLDPAAANAAVIDGDPIIRAGEYRKITALSPLKLTFVSGKTPADLTHIYPSVALFETATPASRLDYAILPTYAPTASTVMGPESVIKSLASDDPFHRGRNNWTLKNSAQVTFGTANPGTLGSASTIVPQQDTDQALAITDVGLRFPAPKGQTDNPDGRMESVAELGHVHSGYESQLFVGGPAVVYYGAPWRSLRLQPQKAGSDQLPDWALLDLFRVPIAPDAPFYEKPNGQPGGRVNLNAALRDFVDGDGNAVVTRLLPLQALLLGASKDGTTLLTALAAEELAKNIADLKPSDNVANPGNLHGLTDFYLTSGQVAEIKGVADGGEAGESLMREIADLAAPRGQAFLIHAVGQAIHQNARGIIVNGERRRRVLVLGDASQPNTWKRVFSSAD